MSMPVSSRLPFLLTVAGLLPFAGLSGATLIFAQDQGVESDLLQLLTQTLLAYAACILSFLGGIRWGAAISKEPVDIISLSLSVCPSLAAWLFLPLSILTGAPGHIMIAFAALFAVQLLWDRAAWRTGRLPDWFGKSRWVASLGAIISLMLAGATLSLTG